MNTINWIGIALKDLGVSRLTARLSGGGDSGSLDDISFFNSDGTEICDGSIESALAEIKIKAGGHDTALFALRSMIDADSTKGDNWWDGPGGHVEASYEMDGNQLVEECIDITVYEEEEFDDDYDDDDYDDDEHDDIEP